MRWPALLFVVAALTVALAVPAGAGHPGANGRLVFERPTPDGPNLFTVAADGSGLTRLTRLRGGEGDSSWSPDGAKVVFTRATSDRGPFEIWLVNADGGGLRPLTRHRGFSIAPAWSPDGRKLVYATDAGRRQPLRLYVMNADGSGQRPLTRNRSGTDYADPQWSPDGKTIAVAVLKAGETRRGFDSSIALIDAADGGDLRRLTPAGGPDELNPNWSPDGASIAFEVNRLFDARQSDIWLMNADGSGKRRLTASRFYETYPAFSPDGTRIAFAGDRDNRKLSTGRLERGFEIYIMATDGSDLTRLTHNRRAELFPDWQPLP